MIGLLLSLIAINLQAQEVLIPVKTLDKMIDRIIVCEGYEYRLNKQDSIIRVYIHKDSLNQVEIAQYKLNEKEYKKIDKDKDLLQAITTKERDQARQEVKTVKRKSGLIIVVQTIIIIILL